MEEYNEPTSDSWWEPIQGGTNGQKIFGLHEFPLSSASPWGLLALGAEGLELIVSL